MSPVLGGYRDSIRIEHLKRILEIIKQILTSKKSYDS
ncbi:MAG: hypothetical protein JWQ54_1694 [Mucilaginibacter sp.]|nr:hypothetical protein [Mucilaginibacter sp.]